MPSIPSLRSWRRLPWLAALFLCAAALAQPAEDPPSRVAHLAYHEGSVVFAPNGDNEWVDLPSNRPLTVGDRLWTDRGARAEVQVGTGTLHMDSESHLGISALDDQAAQFILQQGTVNARVRELATGENFEIDTPNVAVRATAPGNYRVDVAADGSQTRVTVNDGTVSVFGERGQSIEMSGGRQATFTGRQLARLRTPELRQDDFDLWAADRNRLEDASRSARYVPRGVVGYDELDRYGQWAQDADYGPVWFPAINVADWAPYRYGRWDWIAPWGWTWVDDAPWGFAPFHYGRWTMIGHRWAWVPGNLAARPAYAPALVVFLGAGPEVGWYPLAPGEAWYPSFRASPRYLARLNVDIPVNRATRFEQRHYWRDRPDAVTVVRDEDFRRGVPVHQRWQPLRPGLLDDARVGVVPPRPLTPSERARLRGSQPRVQAAPPSSQPAMPSRLWGGAQRQAAPDAQRIEREADRLIRQQQAEQEARRQQEQAAQAQRRQREQAAQALRQQQEQAAQARALRRQQELRAQQERAQRDAWLARQQQEAGRVLEERAPREGWQHREEQQRGDPVMRPPQSLEGLRQQQERAARDALRREREMATPPRAQEPRWQREDDDEDAPPRGRGRWQRNG